MREGRSLGENIKCSKHAKEGLVREGRSLGENIKKKEILKRRNTQAEIKSEQYRRKIKSEQESA